MNSISIMSFFGYGYQPQQQATRNMDVIIEPVNGKGGLYLGDYKAASNPTFLQRRRQLTQNTESGPCSRAPSRPTSTTTTPWCPTT